jgi:hypothetical protein
MHKVDVSFYVNNEGLISLKEKYKFEQDVGENDRSRRTQISGGSAEVIYLQLPAIQQFKVPVISRWFSIFHRRAWSLIPADFMGHS